LKIKTNTWLVLASSVFLMSGFFIQQVSAVSSWTSDTSLSLFMPSEESSFLMPIVAADRGRWHVEARYNYEDLDTGSLFAGITGTAGKTLTVEATPLVGIVFGHTNAVAPGLEIAFHWHQWELTSESEYIFDTEGKESDFFYNWSELSYYLKKDFRVGVVGERTQAYQTEQDYERGPLIGFQKRNFYFTAYVFNVGFGTVYPAFTAGVSF
jgi:hypothetical protein